MFLLTPIGVFIANVADHLKNTFIPYIGPG